MLEPGSPMQLRLESYDVLLIDEVSMLDNDTLNTIEESLRKAQSTRARRALPFGGASVILVGDLLQILPMQRGIALEKPRNSILINQNMGLFKWIELETNFRQREDDQFALFLNQLRIGNLTP